MRTRGELSGRERADLEALPDHPAYARMGRAHALLEADVNLKRWLHWASHSRLSLMVNLARTFREHEG